MQQREPKLRWLVKTGVPSAGGDVQASRLNQGRSILCHTLYLLNVLAARESFAYLAKRDDAARLELLDGTGNPGTHLRIEIRVRTSAAAAASISIRSLVVA